MPIDSIEPMRVPRIAITNMKKYYNGLGCQGRRQPNVDDAKPLALMVIRLRDSREPWHTSAGNVDCCRARQVGLSAVASSSATHHIIASFMCSHLESSLAGHVPVYTYVIRENSKITTALTTELLKFQFKQEKASKIRFLAHI
jgi:hypothetical protein